MTTEDAICNLCNECMEVYGDQGDDESMQHRDNIITAINKLIDDIGEHSANWIECSVEFNLDDLPETIVTAGVECSNCHEKFAGRYKRNYCQNCGAKMI